MKIIGTFVSLPIYLDSFVVGLVANIIGMVVGTALTNVSEKEKEERAKLFVVPEGELDAVEIKKTKRTVAYFVIFGVVVAIVMLFMWAIPYLRML